MLTWSDRGGSFVLEREGGLGIRGRGGKRVLLLFLLARLAFSGDWRCGGRRLGKGRSWFVF